MSDYETNVAIRSSIKSKMELEKLTKDQPKSKWLRDKIRDEKLQKQIELTNDKWLAIPREEYNFELGGYQIQWDNATSKQKEMIRQLQNDNVLAPNVKLVGKYVNDYAKEWKKEKADRGELIKTQHVDTIRFEDVFKIVEFFHQRNGIELTQTRNAGIVVLRGKHNVGVNFSKLIVEVFRELCVRSQEMKIIDADCYDTGYVITLSVIDV
tara:strand:- start:484 stop:1113 length:630 start_codon:yes stop_codon:yes gene_type:complete